jgi:Asp-tRNA(Asn)/Glu-tRNA(Gln) amidotransferase A subunit family amidase
MSEIVGAYLANDGIGLAMAVRQRRFTARVLLDAAIERAEQLNPSLGALCCIDEGRAALAQLDLEGPFVGVPFLIKDPGAPVAGFRTIAGARYFVRHAKAEAADGELGLASEFVVSRSVRDSATMLDACAGAPKGPYDAPVLNGAAVTALDQAFSPLRVGMIDESPADAPVTRERREAVTAAARLLERFGHRIEPIAAAALDCEREVSFRFFTDTICASLAALADDLDSRSGQR